MEPDVGIIIGLLVTLSGVSVLGLSYLGAYLLGRSRGRREMELERRVDEQSEGRTIDHDRVLMVEGAVASMAQAIERLTDAQRVALLERMRAGNEMRTPGARLPQHNTPA